MKTNQLTAIEQPTIQPTTDIRDREIRKFDVWADGYRTFVRNKNGGWVPID